MIIERRWRTRALGWLAATTLLVVAATLAAAPFEHVMPQSRPPVHTYDLGLDLSDEDRRYLGSLPTLRLGIDPDWPPFAFVDERNMPSGISGDYLNYIEKSLHVRFERVVASSWKEVAAHARAGRIDVMVGVSGTGSAAPEMLLTQDYISYPSVIVTRAAAPIVRTLGDLDGATVSMVADSDPGIPPDVLPPGAKRVSALSVDQALRQVARGDVYAYIGNLGAAEPLILQSYAGQLRIAAPTGYSESLHMAVATPYARLVPLINRVLRAIPQEERQHIRNAWLSTQFQYGVSTERLWHVLLPISLLILLFIAVLTVFLASLRAEVRRRRQTEGELRDRIAFQKLMMDTIPIPIFVKDLDNHYLAVNRAYENTLHVLEQEMLGKTSMDASPLRSADDAILERLSREVIVSGEPQHGEMRVVTRDGIDHDVVYWLNLCRTDGQRPTAVLGALADLTDLRNAERRELALKQQLEHITRVLPAVVFELDRIPRAGLFPTFISDHLRTLTDLEPQSVIASPQRFYRLIYAADLRTVKRALARAISRRLAGRVDFRLVRSVGPPLWLRMEVIVRPGVDRRSIVTGYLADVSQTKRQTERLRAAKYEAEEASRVRDGFLATMSHEIRTPMSGVVGILELMSRTSLPLEQGHLLQMARGAAGSLMRLLNDILDFSRNQNGQLTLEPSPFSLREVVDSVSGVFAPEMQRKGLRFDTTVGRNVAPRHIGDAHRVGQILLNLLGNAMKFTEHGAVRLTVTADRHVANLVQYVRISVTDTGVGIAPADQEKLFSPFVQAETSTTRRYGGTGLGLAICRQLAETMGGEISLSSAPGEGTTVSSRIPLPVDDEVAPAPPATRQAWVAIGDEYVRQALVEYLAALETDIFQPGDIVETSDRPLLVFRDSDLALPAVERTLVVVDVTRQVLHDPRPSDQGAYQISASPLRWEDVAWIVARVEGMVPEQDALAGMDPSQFLTDLADGPPVLVVEDQQLNQELLLRQLASLHVHDCAVASNGAEAIQLLMERHFPLVITDCAMPVMDGVELTRRIRRREHDQRGPRAVVIALTANGTVQQREACMAAGADDVLVKPVDMRVLEALLQRVRAANSPRPKPRPIRPHAPGIPGDQLGPLVVQLKASLEVDEMAMAAALDAGDSRTARDAAHRILGAARWFHLEELVGAAQVVEDQCDAGQDPTDAFQILKGSLSRTIAGL